jgi:hypothetical protein
MSAEYESNADILKRKYPQLWRLSFLLAEAFNEINRRWGLPEQPLEQLATPEILITDDMTEEEEMMQYMEYFLKRGHNLEEAEKLAIERKEWVDSLFENMQ